MRVEGIRRVYVCAECEMWAGTTVEWGVKRAKGLGRVRNGPVYDGTVPNLRIGLPFLGQSLPVADIGIYLLKEKIIYVMRVAARLSLNASSAFRWHPRADGKHEAVTKFTASPEEILHRHVFSVLEADKQPERVTSSNMDRYITSRKHNHSRKKNAISRKRTHLNVQEMFASSSKTA